jgi:hypothetical protein
MYRNALVFDLGWTKVGCRFADHGRRYAASPTTALVMRGTIFVFSFFLTD